MGAVSAFTIGSYHCKPLMTDAVAIHNLANGSLKKWKKRWHFS